MTITLPGWTVVTVWVESYPKVFRRKTFSGATIKASDFNSKALRDDVREWIGKKIWHMGDAVRRDGKIGRDIVFANAMDAVEFKLLFI